MVNNRKYATVASFAAADAGFKVGQLRTKTWQTLEMVSQQDLDDKTPRGMKFLKGCDAYWDRQMRKYGVVVGDFTVMADVLDGVCFVTTAATVLAVLPGDRT